MKKLKDEKYKGFTIGFGRSQDRIFAHLKRAPKNIGPVDTTRPIGWGFTKSDTLKRAKMHIEVALYNYKNFELEDRIMDYAPGFRNRGW